MLMLKQRYYVSVFCYNPTMDEVEKEKNEPVQEIQEIVRHFGTDYLIEVIDNPDSPRLTEVASIDAEAFKGQKKLEKEDFLHIFENGGVILGHVGPNNQLISEASLLLDADPEGASLLERNMPTWLGYCDGAAVIKEFRGKGLQKQLLLAREEVAKSSKKEASAASVRQNNVTSIRSMLNTGYVMIADSPHYYGDEEKDGRVVMLKDFKVGNPMKDLDSDHELLEESLRGVIDPQVIQDKLAQGADVISIAVTQSEIVNSEYNRAIATLLRNGYIGTSCNDIDIGDSDSERSDAMTFVKLDTLPLEVQEPIRLRQKEIQTIVG